LKGQKLKTIKWQIKVNSANICAKSINSTASVDEILQKINNEVEFWQKGATKVIKNYSEEFVGKELKVG
jgi:hypothetical protein